jgi:hypothetical protein
MPNVSGTVEAKKGAERAVYSARSTVPDCGHGGRESASACATIHGELQKLGIGVSAQTASPFVRAVLRSPTQEWKSFLTDHIRHIISVDFFTVPTITLKALFAFVLMLSRGREVPSTSM